MTSDLAPMRVWSLRNSVCCGLFWESERIVSDENADAWLKVFQSDEPNIRFVLARSKPKVEQ